MHHIIQILFLISIEATVYTHTNDKAQMHYGWANVQSRFKACLKEYDPVLYLEMNAIYTLDGWMRVSL